MSAITPLQPWTNDEFFHWQTDQPDRYELVDGFPLKMMTGASRRHDTIVVNIIVALGNRLRGRPCQPFTADGAVETRPGQIRRPDVGVDCGPTQPDAMLASEATVIFEVLSPSTRDFDRLRKIAEYKGMAFLRHIVLVEPERAYATLWSRIGQTAWDERVVEGLDAVIALPAIGVDLPMREIYDRLLG
ncbi:Uma2 family endonuclease [Aureimonas sp. AU12]|uniref:Uma2 family endonuclease n=1 Tax=Aureimonas sp. AU12 TaxID=1638161 RepID=UPI0009E68371|nr:Uma2 family endonuclease [Aureimonas sp. AU12]